MARRDDAAEHIQRAAYVEARKAFKDTGHVTPPLKQLDIQLVQKGAEIGPRNGHPNARRQRVRVRVLRLLRQILNAEVEPLFHNVDKARWRDVETCKAQKLIIDSLAEQPENRDLIISGKD
jgi:hypothetical protein